MKTVVLAFASFLLAGVAPPQVGARATDVALKGRGELKVESRGTERLTGATIKFLPGNRFEVELRGHSNHVFAGHVLRTSGSVSHVRIDKAFGLFTRDANGRLTRDMSGEVRMIAFGGKAEGRVFEVVFTTQPGGAGPARVHPVLGGRELARKGVGEVEFGGVKGRVREAVVELQRDGDAKILLRGVNDFTFKGKWRTDGRDRVRLEITEAFGATGRSGPAAVLPGKSPPLTAAQKDIKGSGRVYLSSDAFSRIELSGTARGFKFEGSFRVEG